MLTSEKEFLNYDQQIEKLLSKNMQINDVDEAKKVLKTTSYYSLISGYKDIFKKGNSKNYNIDVDFSKIYILYLFDEALRELLMRVILKIERHIKSLYSYAFTEKHGEKQEAYLNVNNFKYLQYQDEVNKLVGILRKIIQENSKSYDYIQHHKEKYSNVPLWVLVNTLTFGNMSKIYEYSTDDIQIKISKEFVDVNNIQLASMLNVITKFRNVCAHNERLYNYKIKKKSIKDLKLHKKLNENGLNNVGKNDIFSIMICFRYLFSDKAFKKILDDLAYLIDQLDRIGQNYKEEVLRQMGFPKEWNRLLLL